VKHPRLRNLGPRVQTLDTRTAKPLPKKADEHYGTAEHRAWAKKVKDRAGWRCEYVERGQRCENRHPTSVMYADHIEDVKDRPDLALEISNGRCACNSHNTRSGIAARAARMSAKS
jgi:5-methylcytosine-specific restriction protein A